MRRCERAAAQSKVVFLGEMCVYGALRVEFLLKTDSVYPKDTGENKPWQPLGIPSAITPIGQLHQSPPSPIPDFLCLICGQSQRAKTAQSLEKAPIFEKSAH